MSKLRVVTPADAKAAWEALEAEGFTATTRAVCTRLAATGQFHTVHHGTVAKWHKNGWTTKGRQSNRKPASAADQAKVAANLPAVTGDAAKGSNDHPDPEKAKAENATLGDKPTSDLAEAAIREGLISAIKVFRRIQERVDAAGPEDELPKELGALQLAITSSLGRTFEGMKIRLDVADREMKVIPGSIVTKDDAPVDWNKLATVYEPSRG